MAQFQTKVIGLSNAYSVDKTTTGYDQNGCLLYWDADTYDGTVAVYFEAVFKSSSTARTASIALVKVSDNSVVTGTESTTTSTDPVLFRSADVFANLTDNTSYAFAVKIDNAAGTVTAYSVNVIIVQTGAVTKTETQINMGVSAFPQNGSNYSDLTNGFLWTYDADQYDGTVAAYVEAVMYTADSTKTVTVILAKTDGTAVTGATVSTTGAFVYVRSGDFAANLVDGTTYVCRVKNTGATTTTYVTSARVVIQQSGTPTKTETYIPIEAGVTTTSSTSATNTLLHKWTWNDQDWSLGTTPTIYHEASIKSDNASGTTTAAFYQGSAISSVTTTSTTKVLVRSTAFSPTDDTAVVTGFKTSSTARTATLWAHWIVVDHLLPVAAATIPSIFMTTRTKFF